MGSDGGSSLEIVDFGASFMDRGQMETGPEESPNEGLCSCECWTSSCDKLILLLCPYVYFVCGNLKLIFRCVKVIKDGISFFLFAGRF
jgi:hypothetical protein